MNDETIPIGIVWDAAMDDVDTAPIAAPTAELAYKELKHCLRKYARLSEAPRHLRDESENIGELEAHLRWADSHGADRLVIYLSGKLADELARQRCLAAWRGRPGAAWSALGGRIVSAVSDAIEAGALVRGSDEHRRAQALALDCEQRAEIARLRGLRGWPAVA